MQASLDAVHLLESGTYLKQYLARYNLIRHWKRANTKRNMRFGKRKTPARGLTCAKVVGRTGGGHIHMMWTRPTIPRQNMKRAGCKSDRVFPGIYGHYVALDFQPLLRSASPSSLYMEMNSTDVVIQTGASPSILMTSRPDSTFRWISLLMCPPSLDGVFPMRYSKPDNESSGKQYEIWGGNFGWFSIQHYLDNNFVRTRAYLAMWWSFNLTSIPRVICFGTSLLSIQVNFVPRQVHLTVPLVTTRKGRHSILRYSASWLIHIQESFPVQLAFVCDGRSTDGLVEITNLLLTIFRNVHEDGFFYVMSVITIYQKEIPILCKRKVDIVVIGYAHSEGHVRRVTASRRSGHVVLANQKYWMYKCQEMPFEFCHAHQTVYH